MSAQPPAEKPEQLIVRLNQAIQVARLHDVGNIAVEEAVRDFKRTLEDSIQTFARVVIQADHDSELIYFNDKPVKPKRHLIQTIEGVLTLMEDYGLGELRLGKALSEMQVRGMLKTFKTKTEGRSKLELCLYVSQLLEDAGLRGVVDVLSIEQAKIKNQKKTVRVEDDMLVRLAYARTLALLREYMKRMRDPELRLYFWTKLLHAVQGLCSLAEKTPARLLQLSTIKTADDYQYNHAINTCILSILLAKRVGVTKAQLVLCGAGALLHGLGRFRTDQAVVDKDPETRTPKEKKEYGRHPYRAVGELLEQRRMDETLLSAALIAFTFEATPEFPKVSHRLLLRPLAQIVGICEAYDSATTPRPGRPAQLPDAAIGLLLSGIPRAYDATLIQLFVNVVGLFPAGTCVQLNTNEFAVVVHPNPDKPRQPVIAVVRDMEGKDVDEQIIDLAGPSDGPRRTIVQSVDPKEHGLKVPEYLRV